MEKRKTTSGKECSIPNSSRRFVIRPCNIRSTAIEVQNPKYDGEIYAITKCKKRKKNYIFCLNISSHEKFPNRCKEYFHTETDANMSRIDYEPNIQ